MPTKSPRTNITHTPKVKHAIEVARTYWPGERDHVLLLHVLDAGTKALETNANRAEQERQARIRQIAGTHTGTYGPGYLEELRDGWAE